MNKIIPKIFVFVLAFSFASAATFAQSGFDLSNINSDDIHSVGVPDLSLPEPAPAEDKTGSSLKPLPKKEWTIMAFINAKNDLEKFGIEDVNEMEKVGSSSRVNIVVEFGRMRGHSSADGDWTGARRLYIRKDNNSSKVTSPIVQNLGKINMGDWREVIKFVKWAKAKYPARRYMLIIWNHGSGWLEGNPVRETGKGISYDDETGNNIDTPQLALVLARVGNIDIYASDACLMQMASVVYEIGSSVDYIIGSEEVEPGRGYSYDKFLAKLKSNPSMSSLELAKEVVNSYVSFFSGNTQSVINTKKTRYLPKFTNDFVDAVMKAGEKNVAKVARDSAEKYNFEDNKDMYNFVELVVGSTKSKNVRKKGELLMTFLDKFLIAYNKRGVFSRSSHGLAVYLPEEFFYSYTYRKLKWADDTKWDEFIEWLLKK